MAGHQSSISKEELWGGGQSPFSISYGKMMMWYFLVSDALTFGGLLTAYGVIRHGIANPWPVGEQVFESLPFLHGSYPLMYVALMTFILIVSSVTMVLAVEAGHRMDKKGVVKWLGLTIIGGFFFLGSQAWEWSHFIHGSGGGAQIGHSVAVTAKDDKGNDFQLVLEAGSWVHFQSEFGHAYEHMIEHGEEHGHMGKVEVSADGHAVVSTPSHGDHAHGDHADHGHDDHAHGDGHDHAHSEAMEKLYDGELVLMLNKYTLERKDDKDQRKLTVTGAEAKKLWDAIEGNTLAFGANMHKNEYGPQQYANFFFFITGFHGFHVVQGVVINIVIWLMAIAGVFEKRGHYEMVEKIGLFWHFVDLVWVFVFTFYYLI